MYRVPYYFVIPCLGCVSLSFTTFNHDIYSGAYRTDTLHKHVQHVSRCFNSPEAWEKVSECFSTSSLSRAIWSIPTWRRHVFALVTHLFSDTSYEKVNQPGWIKNPENTGVNRVPLLLTWITCLAVILAWISNDVPSKIWGEITYPLSPIKTDAPQWWMLLFIHSKSRGTMLLNRAPRSSEQMILSLNNSCLCLVYFV